VVHSIILTTDGKTNVFFVDNVINLGFSCPAISPLI